MEIINIKRGVKFIDGLTRIWANDDAAYIWVNDDNSLADKAGTFASGSDNEHLIYDAFTSAKYVQQCGRGVRLSKSKFEALQIHIENLKFKIDNSNHTGDIGTWAELKTSAEKELTDLTSRVIVNQGRVNWWYSTETGKHTITRNSLRIIPLDNVDAAKQFGLCVLTELLDQGVVE